MKKYILIFVLTLLIEDTQAQYVESIPIKRNNKDTIKRIKCILTNPKGLVWVGTSYGLCIIKDDKPIEYYHNSSKFPSFDEVFPIENIIDLVDDHLGNIWVGVQITENDGYIFKVNYDRTRVNSIDWFRKNRRSITTLGLDRENRVWVGTTKGLYRITPSEYYNQISTKYHKDSLKVMDSQIAVNCLGMNPKQNLVYIGTEQKLYVRDYHNNAKTNPILESINSILYDSTHNYLWISSTNFLDKELHFLRKRKVSEKKKYNLHLKRKRTYMFVGLYMDQKGNLWGGSDEGLFLMDKVFREPEFVPFLAPFDEIKKLDENYIINCICMQDDKLWVGTERNGLFRIDISNPRALMKYLKHQK